MPFYEDHGTDFELDYKILETYTGLPAMQVHPSYEALLVISPSKQTSIVNGYELPTVTQPSLTVFAPFGMHRTHFEYDTHVERVVFHFGERMMQQYAPMFQAFKPYEQAVYSQFLLSPELMRELEPFFQITRTHRSNQTLMRLNFLSILNIICEKAPVHNMYRKADNLAEINKIIQYMTEHCCENITAEMVCHHFSISRSKLNKDFSKYLSISFHQLLTEMKVSRACHLLSVKDTDIKSVAQALGFEKDTYFYTFFKKGMGMTPLQYRKTKDVKPIAN